VPRERDTEAVLAEGGGMVVLLVIAVVAVVVVALARRGAQEGAGPRTRVVLDARVRQAASLGIITSEQADAIEHLAVATRAPEGRRLGGAVEALAYVGAALAVVGVVTLVAQFWSDLATWSRLTLVGVVAAGLTVAGLLVDEQAGPSLWRLRQVLWLLASGAVALVAGLAAADAFEWGGAAVAIAVGVVTVVHAAALWQLRDRPAQHLAAVAGASTAIAGIAAWVKSPALAGFALLGSGAAWALAGRRDLLPPRFVAVTLGALGFAVGPAVLAGTWAGAAPLAGCAAAGALLFAGARLHEFLFTGTGVAALLAYVPWTVVHYFAGTIGVPVVLLVIGVALVSAMLVLIRREGMGGHPHAI
jgi:hypothetical protein